MAVESLAKRYRVPPRGQPPLAIARATEGAPLRVFVRNEGTGGGFDETPAPLNPFNWMAIGGSGGPLTLPLTGLMPCYLGTEYNDLIVAPTGNYLLDDGAADIIVLAPGQDLYATSALSSFPVMISVQVITGLIDSELVFYYGEANGE